MQYILIIGLVIAVVAFIVIRSNKPKLPVNPRKYPPDSKNPPVDDR